MTIWYTSVKSLLKNLQGALKSLAPWMRASKVAYTQGEAYDEWDNIAEALYEAIVVSPLQYAEGSSPDNDFVRYDSYWNRQETCFISLGPYAEKEPYRIFSSFIGDYNFDVVSYTEFCSVSMRCLGEGRMLFKDLENAFLVVNQTPLLAKELKILS